MTTEVEAEALASREAEHGKKMIAITLRFFTDDIAAREGEIVPRHMADQGYARIETNDAHGIKAGDPLMFHSIAEIAAVIEQLLMKHKIKVHRGQNTRQYIEVE